MDAERVAGSGADGGVMASSGDAALAFGARSARPALSLATFSLVEELPFAILTLQVTRVGADVAAVLAGGVAHVGAAVLAQSRPSLRGDGSMSATSSVLNVVGHKDDQLCRDVAERLAACLGCSAACAGGVHVDNATSEQIAQLAEAARVLADRAVLRLRR